MTKIIAVSDIHGNLRVFPKLKEFQQKYSDATTVFMGDYIDGHKYGFDVLQRVKDQYNDRSDKTVVLIGNHERMLLDFYHNFNDQLWLGNGGKATLRQAMLDVYERSFNLRESWQKLATHQPYVDLLKWLEFGTGYYQIIDHTIFVHAGFDLTKVDPIECTSLDDMLWIRDDYLYHPDTVQIYNGPIDRTPTSKPYAVDFKTGQMTTIPESHVFAHNNHSSLPYTIVSGHTPTVLVYGTYDDGRVGYRNQFADHDQPCPIKKIQYPGEPARYLIDGGNHSSFPDRIGNIGVFDSLTGDLIDSYQDTQRQKGPDANE